MPLRYYWDGKVNRLNTQLILDTVCGGVTSWGKPCYEYPRGSPAKQCKPKQEGMPQIVYHSCVHVLVGDWSKVLSTF